MVTVSKTHSLYGTSMCFYGHPLPHTIIVLNVDVFAIGHSKTHSTQVLYGTSICFCGDPLPHITVLYILEIGHCFIVQQLTLHKSCIVLDCSCCPVLYLTIIVNWQDIGGGIWGPWWHLSHSIWRVSAGSSHPDLPQGCTRGYSWQRPLPDYTQILPQCFYRWDPRFCYQRPSLFKASMWSCLLC